MELQGIGKKVFLDRYARKDEAGVPVEKTPEEMWRRVASAVARVEPKGKREEWEEAFYRAMENFVLVPGGRILSGAGTGYNVTFYNCLPPDQEVLTPAGYKSIKDIRVGDAVITGKKRARRVDRVFTRETQEPLYIIKPTKVGFDDVRVTGEHPILAIKQDWVNRHRSRDGLHLKDTPQWVKAADLRKGDFVAVAWNQEISALTKLHLRDYLPEAFVSDGAMVTKSQLKKPVKEEITIDDAFMLLSGTWLGDGCVTHRTGTDVPAGIQITFNREQREWAEEIAYIMQEKFAVVPTVREDRWGQRLIQVRVESYPVGLFFKNLFGAYSHKKSIPQILMEQPTERLLPLIKGLFRSDGYLSKNDLGIALSNRTLATQLHQVLLRTGRFFTIFQNNAKGGQHDTYRVTGGLSQANGLCEYIFGKKKGNTHHNQDYFLMHDDLFWVRIESIETVPYKGKVYDLEVEEDHSFITGGIVVSNCFVIPSPIDSRQGILHTLSQMVEIMSRGGGVGINLSSLRPRGARVQKVNGFSSGPCNWAELFSVATRDIIQQGGCFAPGTRIMTHCGLVPIEEIVGSKGRSFAATHQGYKEITARFDNGTKAVYEVTTASGLRVTVTAEHKFMTFNQKGEFYLAPLSDLKEGDHAVILLGDWRGDVPLVPLWTNIPKPTKYSNGRKAVSLPAEFTEDLAFFIGVYHADGSKIADEYSENGKGIRIAMAQDRPKDLKTITATIARCFGVTPKIYHGDGAVWDVETFSRSLNEYLVKNKLMKPSSVTVTVPEQVFRSPKSVVAAYLAGVFMGDGTNRGGKGGLRITTVSEQFARELQLILLNLGIASRIKVQERHKQGWRTLYSVTVNGATFMKRFATILAPWTEKVTDHHTSVRDGAFSWPFNVVNRFAYLANFQRTMARTNPMTSQKATLFLQEHILLVNESDRPDVELLASCVPDTITAITPKGVSPVYDLEVTDTHLLSGNGFYTSNSRRGALMLMLWDWHPDVEEFITVKQDLSRINGANLSVCISDAFMDAVKADADWNLVFPDKSDPEYDEKWDGYLPNWQKLGKKVIIQKTIKARALWDLIATAAWKSAEPGVVFMERYNKWFNNSYWEYVNCVNPCGEEGLPNYGVCNLTSINLAALVNDNGEMDYDRLADVARVGVRFQDDVIDADVYIFPEIRKRQIEGERRIGLGTMGLGDALIKMKLRYGSKESLAVIDRIYQTIRDAAYASSVAIAEEKGAFPGIDKKKHLDAYFIRQLPEEIRKKMKRHGVRNSVILQQAPTGSTSLMAGVSSGIEPVYEFEFMRRDRLGEHVLRHPLFDAWHEEFKVREGREPVKEDRPDYFVSANDLTPEDHVYVQAAIQKYVDASISKTVNAPKTHTVEDVKRLYTLAYDLGCKGIAYMREGSRQGVLERIEAKETKQGGQEQVAVSGQYMPEIKPRPMVVHGSTYQVETPVGQAYVTINTNGGRQPLELFMNIGKAGSDVTAMAEAMGRLISLIFRIASPVSPIERAHKVAAELIGIGGARSLGFGENRVRSLPDAVAKVIDRHFGFFTKHRLTDEVASQGGDVIAGRATNGSGAVAIATVSNGTANGNDREQSADEASYRRAVAQERIVTVDFCPSCGEGSLVFEESCKKCYACGYSEC
jgi:ribonucleoside-diphosphate reductase alpha chain